MSRARRVRPRPVPAGITDPVPGQYALFGAADPWQPSGCTQRGRDLTSDCWPPKMRGCGHCKNCDTCQDCGQCAGAGCGCACEG
ncbi:hypothetical protein [Streptomyces griseofuscus]|uniref:hypothetical protein n=1 Tax=Streptomyces griseofuscus TaxID=146922 RepID=UPI00340DF7FD